MPVRTSLSTIAAVGFAAVLLTAPTAVSATDIPNTLGLAAKTYNPLPKRALASGSISFTPLSSAALAVVRLSPELALNDLKDQFTMPAGSWVSSISLGGYVNTLDIVHDWSGTTSKSPKRVATYMVTIRGLTISSLGPSHEGTANHEEVFIANATTGKVMSSFSYR
jgi:hypothetical protein